jgi:hypothetical protein
MAEELQPPKVDVKPCEERVSRTTTSGNDSPLDLKSIKASSSDDSEVLAILVFLVESVNVNSQIIQDAVDGIDRLFSKTLKLYQSTTTATAAYDRDDPGAEMFLWMLWGLLLEVARKVPYNHPKQEVLVDFLKRLDQKEAGTVRIRGVSIAFLIIIPFPHTRL